MRKLRGRSILRRQVLGLVVLVLLIVATAALGLWGLQASMGDLLRAEQSFRQLENARQLEATFNRYLAYEVNRRLEGGGDPAESRPAGELRGALLTYHRRIGREIATAATEQDRADERVEMVRASILSDIFERIETESMIDRVRGEEYDAATSAKNFLTRIARGRDEAFRSVVYEIIEDENEEADAAFAGLELTRSRLTIAGIVLLGCLVITVLTFTILFHRGLMRPIRRLAGVAGAFGEGAMETRAPDNLPGEFAALSRQFNRMADRIASEQGRLQTDVAARTEELARANAELRRIDEARRRFFANISHELRTPVTVLLGEAQIGARAQTVEEMRDALDRIAASGGFLRRRLDDLMRLARSEDGQITLTLREMDLSTAVRSAAEIAAGYAAAHEVTIHTDLAETIKVTGDAEALRQATLALIDNAIKFSPPGSEICISTTVGDKFCTILVSDSGPGFEGDDPETLFDRYAQESTGRQAGGTGLGLSITKWIVDQHGGQIRVANRASGGAEFKLEIPR
ncbi:HAMP domain-containing histidine kinase [Rhodobacteraceae bacterium NNCM2]|nr:HAMP domain-containing histidine kinase [Coraliihabitans acroporae]